MRGATITHMSTTLHIVSMIAEIVAAVMISGGFIIWLIGALRDDDDLKRTGWGILFCGGGIAFIAFGFTIFLLI